MPVIQGVLKNSHIESNFISFYMRGSTEEEKQQYIKVNIVTRHADLIRPFVWITKHDQFHRENQYKIDFRDGVTPVVNNILYQSHRNSDCLMKLPKAERYEFLKDIIAAAHVRILLPFVYIINHDEEYREIEYEIRLPEPKNR